MSRARLLAEVRKLRAGVERGELALEHAGRAIVSLRHGVDAGRPPRRNRLRGDAPSGRSL
jgi:hypothetical protein